MTTPTAKFNAMQDIALLEQQTEDEYQNNRNYQIYLKAMFKLLALTVRLWISRR